MGIIESDMKFIEFSNDQFCHIETTSLYKRFLSFGVKTVEFVLLQNRKGVNVFVFVEAKKTFPNPKTALSYDEGIEEIALKFIHTIELITAVLTGIHCDDENELIIFQGGLKGAKIVLTLVISNHKDEWLMPVADTLNRRLKAHKKIWNIDKINVMNKESAIEHGLVMSES